MPRRVGQIDLFTRRVRRPPPAPEFHTHCMVADVLRRFASPDWRFTHIPLGEKRAEATAARLKRMGVVAGWPDFILLPPNGRAHFLEMKRGRGGTLTEAQAEFAAWCRQHDVPFAIARDFTQALTVLQDWGAVRTGIQVAA